MEWTPQQAGALTAVSQWLKTSDPVFRLFGYAGTGKTTLARHLAQGVDGDVFFGAYTGKASLVLRQKGCPGARTIHSLIYKARELSREKLLHLEEELKLEVEGHNRPRIVESLKRQIKNERTILSQPKFNLEANSPLKEAALVVIDECSMVDEGMGADLLSFGCKVLVLGDPAQLPPVKGGGFFTNHEPDVMLTDVQRQARDNPIVELATRVREGRKLERGDYGESRIISRHGLHFEELMEAEQVLVGYNATRRAINARIRHARGFHAVTPVVGDRLVCLRNDRDLGVLNGGLFEAVNDAEEDGDSVHMTVRSTDEERDDIELEAHLGPFLGEDLEMPWWERKRAQEFDYGYALTVHKSQGSQWNHVLLRDEWGGSSRQRWLYTGITRAAEKITLVQG